LNFFPEIVPACVIIIMREKPVPKHFKVEIQKWGKTQQKHRKSQN